MAEAHSPPATGGGALEEAELRRIVELAPQILAVMERDGRVSWANRLALDYFGISESDLATIEVRSRVVHPDDIAKLDAERQKALAGGLPFEAEQRMLGKEGKYRWFLIRYVPLKDQEGGLLRWYAAATDIEDRKRQEEAVQRSETYLAAAQTMSHTGSWAWDIQTDTMVYCSEETSRIFGIDPNEGLPSVAKLLERVHPEDRDRVRDSSRKAERAVEYRLLMPDGTVKHILSMRQPLLDAHGQVVEMLGTAMDVTERKRAEQERERSRRLEAELAHVNRVSMMGELAAALSHELRQPITAAMTNANACLRWLDRGEAEKARKSVAMIVQDGNRATGIIDRMRSFYRKGAPPERELVDMNEVIGEMLVLLRPKSMRHSIPMRTDLAAQLPPVLADRVQLQQVLLNLMLNGVESMRDTGGELTIRSQLGDDGAVLIAIRDAGEGLPAGSEEQMFKAFFTTKPQGSGMGLAISRSLVESHGGRLWATANAGRGATFHFSLPAAASGEGQLLDVS